MKTLIIDTTKTNMFLGLINENKTQIAQVLGLGKHNETLLPSIDKLLEENNLTLADIEYVAINVGPGSFTGIRVGVSTVKAFCIALEKIKCVAFTSFDVLAYSNSVQGETTLVVSAGANNMYVAKCDGKNITSMQHNTFEEFNQTQHQNIVANIEEKDILPINNINYVKNLKYFELVEDKIAKEDFSQTNTLEPLYLRLSQAERELNDANRNAN